MSNEPSIDDSDISFLCGANENPSLREFAKKCALWGMRRSNTSAKELATSVRALLRCLTAVKGYDDRYRLRVVGDPVAAHRAEQRVLEAMRAFEDSCPIAGSAR